MEEKEIIASACRSGVWLVHSWIPNASFSIESMLWTESIAWWRLGMKSSTQHCLAASFIKLHNVIFSNKVDLNTNALSHVSHVGAFILWVALATAVPRDKWNVDSIGVQIMLLRDQSNASLCHFDLVNKYWTQLWKHQISWKLTQNTDVFDLLYVDSSKHFQPNKIPKPPKPLTVSPRAHTVSSYEISKFNLYTWRTKRPVTCSQTIVCYICKKLKEPYFVWETNRFVFTWSSGHGLRKNRVFVKFPPPVFPNRY